MVSVPFLDVLVFLFFVLASSFLWGLSMLTTEKLKMQRGMNWAVTSWGFPSFTQHHFSVETA